MKNTKVYIKFVDGVNTVKREFVSKEEYLVIFDHLTWPRGSMGEKFWQEDLQEGMVLDYNIYYHKLINYRINKNVDNYVDGL